MQKLPVAQFPTTTSSKSSSVVDRLTNAENLSLYLSSSLPLRKRAEDMDALASATAKILLLYANAVSRNTLFKEDFIRIAGFMLQEAAVLPSILDEAAPTLSKSDPSYATRMAALDQTKRGLAQQTQAAILMLEDRDIYTDESREKLASIVSVTFPVIAKYLPTLSREEFITTLKRIAMDEKDTLVKASILKAISAPVGVAPVAGSGSASGSEISARSTSFQASDSSRQGDELFQQTKDWLAGLAHSIASIPAVGPIIEGILKKMKPEDQWLVGAGILFLILSALGGGSSFKKKESSDRSPATAKSKGLTSVASSPLARCNNCQEVIAPAAKICKHCGTRFPHLAEPARSHVQLISEYYIKGASSSAITLELNKQDIKPANGRPSWDDATIAEIIRNHIQDDPSDSDERTNFQTEKPNLSSGATKQRNNVSYLVFGYLFLIVSGLVWLLMLIGFTSRVDNHDILGVIAGTIMFTILPIVAGIYFVRKGKRDGG